MSVTIVVNNSARDGLAAEHGLSFWIEAAGRRVLFDTGQGQAFRDNVAALDLDLSTADHVVLSHGHYDHGGNLAWVLDQAPRATVHWHPDAMVDRYSIHEGQVRFIGLADPDRDALTALASERRAPAAGPVTLAPGLTLTGAIARDTTFEDTGGPFYRDCEGQVADLIPDDLSIWYDTPAGLVVCLGCAHAGVVNILTQVRRQTGNRPIHTVIGGMHLVAADDERLTRTVAFLRDLAPRRLVACHCTGDAATAYLQEQLGDMVAVGAAGQVWDA